MAINKLGGVVAVARVLEELAKLGGKWIDLRSTRVFVIPISKEEYNNALWLKRIDEKSLAIYYDEIEGLLYFEESGKPIERWTCGRRNRKLRRKLREARAEIKRLEDILYPEPDDTESGSITIRALKERERILMDKFNEEIPETSFSIKPLGDVLEE